MPETPSALCSRAWTEETTCNEAPSDGGACAPWYRILHARSTTEEKLVSRSTISTPSLRSKNGWMKERHRGSSCSIPAHPGALLLPSIATRSCRSLGSPRPPSLRPLLGGSRKRTATMPCADKCSVSGRWLHTKSGDAVHTRIRPWSSCPPLRSLLLYVRLWSSITARARGSSGDHVRGGDGPVESSCATCAASSHSCFTTGSRATPYRVATPDVL